MATKATSSPADINAYDGVGRTKIYRAAEAGNAAKVARLLELKAEIELPNDRYRKYVSLFNDKKNINLFNLIQHSYTPLHIACGKGHAPVVRLLLQAGANVESNDRYGFACVVLNEFMTSID